MTPIYSSAAIKTRQREVKDAARENVVHITENGNAAFVLDRVAKCGVRET